MRVDVRPVSRLRGKEPLNVTAALGPVIEALCASEIDLSRISVVCDWIQYRSNFREVADYRPVLAPWPGGSGPDGDAEDRDSRSEPPAEAALEMAIDLRRYGDTDLRAVVAALLQEHADPASSARVPLEPWAAGRQSCIWRFNALYWQALSLWEQATGRDYYRRLNYIMGDYSPHVLGRAMKAVAHHGEHVSALVVDATHPAVSLGFLRGKAFLAYISNVYDNLPSDEVARLGGRTYQVETRAYLPGDDAKRIARRSRLRRSGFPS